MTKRPGRPRKSKKTRRVPVDCYVTRKTKARWKRKATSAGVPLSIWIVERVIAWEKNESGSP